MRVYSNGYEWWAAESPEDATRIASETCGITADEAEGEGWKEVLLHESLDDGITVADWLAMHREPGLVCGVQD